MKKLVQKVVDGEIVEVEEEVSDDQDDDNQDDDQQKLDDQGDDQQLDDLDDEDEDTEGKDDTELWMSTEDKQQSLADVPVSTHIRIKQKLKGRISERDDEIQRLKDENAALKAGVQSSSAPVKALPKRPNEDDFDTLQEYREALSQYENQMIDRRMEDAEQRRQLKANQAENRRKLDQAVDSHYERAAKLVSDNKINTDLYKKTDTIVRETVENIHPKRGDIIVDHMISVLGDGSEKVMFYLGRNKKALETFEQLLSEDGTGLKASVFLGEQKQRLLNSRHRTSAARPPATDINGDQTTQANKGGALLKKRQAALKKGNVQEAYNIKKQARAAGVDVSNW